MSSHLSTRTPALRTPAEIAITTAAAYLAHQVGTRRHPAASGGGRADTRPKRTSPIASA